MRTLVFCGRTLALRIVPKGDGHAVRITSGGCPTRFLVGTGNRNWRKTRSEEHTSELQSRLHLVCRLLLEKKKHAVRQRGDLNRPAQRRVELRQQPLDVVYEDDD